MSESMMCPDRKNYTGPNSPDGTDQWRVMPNGDRTCSFCGSLHPDDFLALCKLAGEEGADVRIVPTDKDYKVYVHRNNVANAIEGGMKFYKWHVVAPVTEKQSSICALAMQRYREWFGRMAAYHGASK